MLRSSIAINLQSSKCTLFLQKYELAGDEFGSLNNNAESVESPFGSSEGMKTRMKQKIDYAEGSHSDSDSNEHPENVKSSASQAAIDRDKNYDPEGDDFNVPFENCFQTVFKVITERKNRIRRKASPGWSSKLA